MMTWPNFYLICFLLGFLLSVISFLLGALHGHIPGVGHLHVHLPHGHVHLGAGHVNLGTPHPPLPAGGQAATGARGVGSDIPFFNFSTLMAFLAWFGGMGYLLATDSTLSFFVVLALSILSGMGGASLVFLFLAKVLMRSDSQLRESDYDMVGVLGTVCSGIREGGTGEIIFEVEDVRRTCGARSEKGTAIGKGTEVVVTRYERGLAYVRPYQELTEESDEPQPSARGTSS